MMVQGELVRNYREIKRDIDAMEEDALPCLQDALCECDACKRYLTLGDELSQWLKKYDFDETQPEHSSEDIASRIVRNYAAQCQNHSVPYSDHLKNAIAAAIQAERERK